MGLDEGGRDFGQDISDGDEMNKCGMGAGVVVMRPTAAAAAAAAVAAEEVMKNGNEGKRPVNGKSRF